MDNTINWKKINLFLLLTFGISWVVAGLLKILHLELSSIPAFALVAVAYMPAPAIATVIVQKLIYKEDFKSYGWTFDKNNWKWLIYTILLSIALLLLTLVAIAAFGNTHYWTAFGEVDFSQEGFNNRLIALIQEKIGTKTVDISKLNIPPFPPVALFPLFIFQGIVAAFTLNLPFMFGEEFGWRGLLLRELQKMGFMRSSLFIGIIWGIWHAPIIMMGHNYPTHPYFGVVMMCIFTTALCPLFAYIRFKSKTILGPCLLHGMINGTAGIFALYIANSNELFSSIAGWAGVIACALTTLGMYIFDKEFVNNFAKLDIPPTILNS
jgi:uncharacterized protein